jgi:hypothetical protein
VITGERAARDERAARYAAWYQDLDSWTEYWDIYHPETHGFYYFGDGPTHPGLLSRLLPSPFGGIRPVVFDKWSLLALYPDSAGIDRHAQLEEAVRAPGVREAVSALDELVRGLFQKYFGRAEDADTRRDYLEASFLFGADLLPPATARLALIPEDDLRRASGGRHTVDGDLMWFAWALHVEAAEILFRGDAGGALRALLLAGVAVGAAANFAWRGHRHTRREYRADDATCALLAARGEHWARNFDAASAEVHALYRIREWGDDSPES